jgi:acetyl esterase
MPVDSQFQDVIAMLSAMPSLSEIPIETFRSFPMPVNPAPTPVDEVSNRKIPGPAGDIGVRIYRQGSGTDLPLLLFAHGGGFVLGNLDTHDEIARGLTAETGCVTVAVDYRLAPENPFPAAPDDCFTALRWAAANARSLGADPDRIAVIGDSAGGNLAAGMALEARDKGGPSLKGQVLIYPVVDLTTPLPPPPGGEYYVLNPKEGEFFNRSYLPDRSRASDPRVSPVLADLRDLPPTLVITAEYDPLCAQGEAYVAKLKQAGVDATLARYDGAVHGFMSFPVPMGRQASLQVADWLKARFAA